MAKGSVMGIPRVGGAVDSWCTRCRLILAHTIEAMVGGKITRVHCNTCGGQHTYRAQPPGGAASDRARKTRPTKGAKTSATARTNDYQTLLRNRGTTAIRPYAPSARFRVGDIISHTAFGIGAVTGEKDGTKIEVLFADGPRVLIHGR